LAAAFSNAVNLMTHHSASTAPPQGGEELALIVYLIQQLL